MPYQKLSVSTGYILCYKVSGTVTAEDYTELLVPDVDSAYQSYGKVRILLDISDFRMKDMQWAAMWQDAKFGMKLGRIEKFALICHHQIIAYAVGFLLGATYQPFSSDNTEAAFEWIFADSSFKRPEIKLEAIMASQSERGSLEHSRSSKYLIALDSAEPARVALSQALHLVSSGDFTDEIHLMTVITDDSDAELLKKTLSDASALVLDVFSSHQHHKISTFEHIVNTTANTSVATAIINVASEINADYIIIGTKNIPSRSSLSESVCLEVIRTATCPVLVCKAKDAPVRSQRNPISASKQPQAKADEKPQQKASGSQSSANSKKAEPQKQKQEASKPSSSKEKEKTFQGQDLNAWQQKHEQEERKEALNKEILQTLPKKQPEPTTKPKIAEKPLNEKAQHKDEKTKHTEKDKSQKGKDEKPSSNTKSDKNQNDKAELGAWGEKPGVELFQ